MPRSLGPRYSWPRSAIQPCPFNHVPKEREPYVQERIPTHTEISHANRKFANPSPSSGESANSRSLCSADLKAMCEASASRLSIPTSPSATQKRVERCSLGRSLALPRTARHIVGRALDIRLESKLSDAMTTARFPARPAEIFNGRNRRGSLRKINPCGYRHDRAALGNLRNMTTARQRRLWPPAPCGPALAISCC